VPQVAYSDCLRNWQFATPCQTLPPKRQATFYASFCLKPDILRQKSGSEPSYSGNFCGNGRQRQATAAFCGLRIENATPKRSAKRCSGFPSPCM